MTIQVKALSRRVPVPLGGRPDGFIAGFIVICRGVQGEQPESFVPTPEEVTSRVHHGVKDGVSSYWLQPREYEVSDFRERWDKIGAGT